LQASFEIQASLQGEAWWGDLVVSPSGQLLAGGGFDAVTLLQVDRLQAHGKEREQRDLLHSDGVRRLCFSADGRFLAVGAGRSAWLWDLSGQREEVRFRAFRQRVERLAFHPNGHLFAAGSRDGEVRVYVTSSTKEVLRLDLKLGEIRGLAFAPDGMTAVVAGKSKRVAVWDVD
jgi:WD40 repeat protein